LKKILVIAPHPDDETIGCGGSLFRHKKEGDELFWLIVTNIHEKEGWPLEKIKKRSNEIKAIKEKYLFKDVFNLDYPTTKIDIFPISELINRISDILKKIAPEVIYMPFVGDVHTDHQITANAIQSSIKWFRQPSIKKILMYETLSESEFNFIGCRRFCPNVFVDISNFLNDKIETMNIYASEIGKHPFPRCEKAIRALAILRGSQSGFESAEAFELVLEYK